MMWMTLSAFSLPALCSTAHIGMISNLLSGGSVESTVDAVGSLSSTTAVTSPQSDISSYSYHPFIVPTVVGASSSSATGAALPPCKHIQDEFVQGQGGNPARAAAVQEAYLHGWDAYYTNAFPRDELLPLSRSGKNDRYGWGLTVIDGLDTAMIMGLEDVAQQQLDFVATQDFYLPYQPSEQSRRIHERVSMFETSIRYLGGLLSAHDMLHSKAFDHDQDGSEADRLLGKAVVLADQLSFGFNTPSGIAATYVDFARHEVVNRKYVVNRTNATHNATNAASIGTFLLEWYRLSDLTGNDSYKNLADRSESYLIHASPAPVYPGLVGFHFDTTSGEMLDYAGGWQSSIDSFLEYLIKAFQYSPAETTVIYKDFWRQAVESTVNHLIQHPHGFDNLTFIDQLDVNGSLEGTQDNYACFAGGNFLLGCKLLGLPELCQLGLDVTDSCHWTYNHTLSGLGPVEWKWFNDKHEQPSDPFAVEDSSKRANAAARGFYISDSNSAVWVTFPETIESIFYAYRITGDKVYQDWAWEIFQTINTTCRNEAGFAMINNVDMPYGGTQRDHLDSFFFAETLKYLYLTFADPGEINLDRWVFNTEGHPLLVQCQDNADTLRSGRG